MALPKVLLIFSLGQEKKHLTNMLIEDMSDIFNQFFHVFLNISPTYPTTPPQLKNKFIKYMHSKNTSVLT